MYTYIEGIDRMTDRYKYINKGLQINRSMDIYTYTSRERSIDIDRHRHIDTHTQYTCIMYTWHVYKCVLKVGSVHYV